MILRVGWIETSLGPCRWRPLRHSVTHTAPLVPSGGRSAEKQWFEKWHSHNSTNLEIDSRASHCQAADCYLVLTPSCRLNGPNMELRKYERDWFLAGVNSAHRFRMSLQSYFLFKAAHVCSRRGGKSVSTQRPKSMYSSIHVIIRFRKERRASRAHGERFVLPLCSPGTASGAARDISSGRKSKQTTVCDKERSPAPRIAPFFFF